MKKCKMFGEDVLLIETEDVKIGDKIVPKTWTIKQIESFFGEFPIIKRIKSESRWNEKEKSYEYCLAYFLNEEETSVGYFFKPNVYKVIFEKDFETISQ